MIGGPSYAPTSRGGSVCDRPWRHNTGKCCCRGLEKTLDDRDVNNLRKYVDEPAAGCKRTRASVV